MNAHAKVTFSKPDFRRWVENKQDRYELVDGEPRMMVRVKRGHDTIVMNWFVELRQSLDKTRYAVHSGEFALSTGPFSFRLPDVSVEAVGLNPEAYEFTEPYLLVEVLSPSTSYTDFTDKRAEYTAIPSLEAYVICAQDARRVWLFVKGEDGWPQRPEELSLATDLIKIPALGLEIALPDLYFGVSVSDE